VSVTTTLGGLPVLLDGSDWFAIDKPSGLPVHRGYTGERDTVVDRLRPCLGGTVHPAHRLDRGTSGVQIIARTREAARSVGDAFSERRVHKRYVALCRGVVPEAITIDYAVPTGPERDAVRADARTRIVRLGMVRIDGSPLKEPRYSFVLAEPETGRFHQVRRHLAHIAHPILGDSDHGRPDHNRFLRGRVGLSRLALHAASLRFLPPSGEEVEIWAPLPDDLTTPLLAMGFDLEAALALHGLGRLA
jgi:tRNA pseudouridine65 synthase